MTRERVSLAIAALGAVFLGGRGLWVYLQDGSYFLDAASVVVSLEKLTLAETFTGPLETGHSFPRAYLALVRALRWLLGPETWVTRLLPVAAYLGATVLWMRLFWMRFRREPLLVALGVVLVAWAAPWWVYAAVVKHYSLEVLLVLVLFSLPDSFVAESLGGRRRVRAIAVLVLPVFFSYTYAVALVARMLAWGFVAWRAGRAPGLVPCCAFAAVLAAALALLGWTDLRHAFGQPALVRVWESCIASAQPPSAWPGLLRRSWVGWYEGPVEFVVPPAVPAPVSWALLVASAVGAGRILAGAPSRDGSDDAWGSRSLACVVAAGGAVASSLLLATPLCAGRSLLYLLPLQQVVLLEGLALFVERAEGWASTGRLRALRAGVGLALALLLAVAAAKAWELHGTLAQKLPLENFRPLLARIRAEPPRPVLATHCATRQLRTLPEGLDGLDVVFLPVEGWRPLVPRGEAVWILHSRLTRRGCEPRLSRLHEMTRGFERSEGLLDTAVLYDTETLPLADEPAARGRVSRPVREAKRGG